MFEAYRDRKEAGQRLGRELQRTLPSLLRQHSAPAASVHVSDVVVLGLVRGGMPVAEAVAQALGSHNLDAFVVRKVGAPHQPE
jgi:predicted phosphoribosyltransferase